MSSRTRHNMSSNKCKTEGKTTKSEFRSMTPLAVKMAARSQEIRPVGAWVQVGESYDDDAVVCR